MFIFNHIFLFKCQNLKLSKYQLSRVDEETNSFAISFNPLSAKSGIYDMTPWSLRTAVTPDTVKIMKNFRVRAWNFLQNDIQNFVFWLIHSWEIALQVSIFKKKPQKKALALKGLSSKSIWKLCDCFSFVYLCISPPLRKVVGSFQCFLFYFLRYLLSKSQ